MAVISTILGTAIMPQLTAPTRKLQKTDLVVINISGKVSNLLTQDLQQRLVTWEIGYKSRGRSFGEWDIWITQVIPEKPESLLLTFNRRDREDSFVYPPFVPLSESTAGYAASLLPQIQIELVTRTMGIEAGKFPEIQ